MRSICRLRGRGRPSASPAPAPWSAADDLAKPSSVPTALLYHLAGVHALAADRDGANREQHIRHSLELLRRAVDHGFRDAEQLRADADLKPLHDCEDFCKLLAALENPPTDARGGSKK